MYNYNRLGPFSNVDVDVATWEPGAITIDSWDEKVYPKCNTATPVDHTGSARVWMTTQNDLGTLQMMAFGIPVNGTLEGPLAMQYGFAAHCMVLADKPVTIRPFVARCDNATIVTTTGAQVNPCSHPRFLGGGSSILFSTEWSMLECNTSVILEDRVGKPNGAQTDTNPLIFGVAITDLNSLADLLRVDLTMSVHRGIRPIDTYESGR
jgi:hypothetical protein